MKKLKICYNKTMIINDHGPERNMLPIFSLIYMGCIWVYIGIYIRYWSYFCPYVFFTYFYAVHSDWSSSFKYTELKKMIPCYTLIQSNIGAYWCIYTHTYTHIYIYMTILWYPGVVLYIDFLIRQFLKQSQ